MEKRNKILIGMRDEIRPITTLTSEESYNVLASIYTILYNEIRKRSVYELPWSTKTSNFMLKMGIKTIGDLIDYDIGSRNGMLPASIAREIYDTCLTIVGIDLKQWRDTIWKNRYW